jgi:hypothetical protein
MKKTLVVLLALVMIFAFAATAMADDTQYVPYGDIADQDSDIQTAIERLSVLGALKGYDAEGTVFAPDQLITREEFATVGVRVAGLEDQVALYAALASAFSDVEEGRWSEGYINCANANGIMIGRGNGVFDPKAYVTMQEVVTVLLRAVGYDDRLPGSWPTDYNNKAVQVGLAEYVDFVGPKYATRAEVASMTNEALDLYVVYYVDNEFAQGLGQAIGFISNMLMTDDDFGLYGSTLNLNYVDENGYAYRSFKTNEGNYARSPLLYETFDAYVVPDAVFDDRGWAFSELSGWGFTDFDDWELEVYLWWNEDITYPDDWLEILEDLWWYDDDVDTIELASLYGISDDSDVTDLGWQVADLTLIDEEVVYIDLLSEITRTDEADDDYIGWLCLGYLPDEGYGEYWYYDWSGKGTKDDDNYYTSKDFSNFECYVFGIVDGVDGDEVNFKDTPAAEDIDLDDSQDEAFYLMGEGFIAGEDLEDGDVVYFMRDEDQCPCPCFVLDEVDVYLVFRLAEGILDDYSEDFIEVDDVEYGVNECGCGFNSYYSADQGNTVDEYGWWYVVEEIDFSADIMWAPSYAFVNFAYFVDDLMLYNYGILDSYEFGTAATKKRLNDNLNYETITGMNVLLPGDDALTTIDFDQTWRTELEGWGAPDIAELFPEEGSLIEFVLNNDGECTGLLETNIPGPYQYFGHSWNKYMPEDWLDGVHEPELLCYGIHGAATGVWSSKGRLEIALYNF